MATYQTEHTNNSRGEEGGGIDPDWRRCGICGAKSIQRGVDWPWWKDGMPVHIFCLRTLEAQVPSSGESK